MTDAELIRFMTEEWRHGRNSDVIATAAARCGGDTDRVWRLLEPACEVLLRELPEDDGPSLDQPYVVRWRHRVKRSSLKAARRWVLIALSQYGNKHGNGRYPSTLLLARDTGYTRRAVEGHLRGAVDDGWLARRTRGVGGQGWAQYTYQLVTPPDVGNGIPQLEPYAREERWEHASGRSDEDGNEVPDLPRKGWERHDKSSGTCFP